MRLSTTGPPNDHLELDAIRVNYFGIGYASEDFIPNFTDIDE